MDSFRISELIKLSVLSRLNSKDSKELLDSMNHYKDFPLDELGRFQNLAAILCLPIEEVKPSTQIKHQILQQIESSPNAENLNTGTNLKFEKTSNIFSKLKPEEQNHEKTIPSTLKIKDPDLSDLVIFDRSKEFEEVRSRVAKLRENKKETNKENESQKIKLISSKDSANSHGTEKRNKVKKILIAAGLFMVLLAFTSVIYFQIFDDETLQASTDIDQMHKEMISKSIVENTINTNEVYSVSDQEQTEQLPEVQELESVVVESEKDNNVKKEEIVEQKKTATNLPPLENPEIIAAPLTDPIEETEEIKTEQPTLLIAELPPPENGKKIIEEENNYFIAVEEMPEPIGGLSTIQSKIVYPELAVRAGVEGKVYIRAFVDENGKVTKAEVIKGIGMGCDEAAVNAVLDTIFKPGKQRGRPIKVQVTVAITFKL